MGDFFRLNLEPGEYQVNPMSFETEATEAPRRSGFRRKMNTSDSRFSGSQEFIALRSNSTPTRLDPAKTGNDATLLESRLQNQIIGQDDAIAQIVNMYQLHLTGLSSPNRPIGNFLFLGPTGSGKTRTVEALAEALVGTHRAVIKIDCAEFQHSHEIAKLIGSPPGYLGHRETHPLFSQEVLTQYHTDKVKISFVLFDEIEKASDALWNLLLGVLDKATLTLGDNRRVDFSQTMIFMTSNLGAAQMNSLIGKKVGFEGDRVDAAAGLDDKTKERLERTGVEAARKKFTPEFMNRLDKVVVFKPLGDAELRRILDIELGAVQQRIFRASVEKAFIFSASTSAKDAILKAGTDPKYGARHLKRAIEKMLVQPLSNLIGTEQIRGGDLIRIDAIADASEDAEAMLTFDRLAEGLTIETMVEMTEFPSYPRVTAASAVAQETTKLTARSSRRS